MTGTGTAMGTTATISTSTNTTSTSTVIAVGPPGEHALAHDLLSRSSFSERIRLTPVRPPAARPGPRRAVPTITSISLIGSVGKTPNKKNITTTTTSRLTAGWAIIINTCM